MAPELKLPEAPILFAGGVGGPFCMMTVTPFRNALTYASKDASLSVAKVFGRVFTSGLASGWTGGGYVAVAACPQFLCIGPVYHIYAGYTGAVGGIILTGITETAVLYGAETKNAQLAIQARGGHMPKIQSPFNPIGPGVGLACIRNIVAMSGMRVVNEPIANAFEKVAGKKSGAVSLASDLTANVFAACMTAPIHMLFQYTATTPELWGMSSGQKIQEWKNFLNNQYFPGGKLSSTVGRDLFLRSLYIATVYTMFVNIERTAVRHWPF